MTMEWELAFAAVSVQLQSSAAVNAKNHQASDLEVPEVGAVAESNVDAGGDADEPGDGNIDVRQRGRAETVEKQRVPGRLARHGARRREEEIAEERERAAQIPAIEPQRTSDKAKHEPAESTAYILIPDP